MPESPSELGQIQSLRRSVTLPTKLNPLAQRRASVPNTPEHVIFYHPSAKIVHFSPKALAPIPSSSAPSDFDYPVDTIETLPWRSATERTVATAPLRLEKIHGSTAFLKCGNVVHAILKNSQCWCVDGVSKFVLRIRPLTYYRIEIPYETEDDRSLVQDLKKALPTVLRYEVTPCPFKRAFSVELPNDAITPRRKKAWRPKDRKEMVPTVLEPPQETSSPSSTRSDWVDSASTGDDTDGNLTDDSCFTSNLANSTMLETISDNREKDPVDILISSPYLGPVKRPVNETPQTFTSLLAKFEATTISEDAHDPESDLIIEDAYNAEIAMPVDPEVEDAADYTKREFPAEDTVEVEPEFDASLAAEFATEVHIEPEPEPESEAGAESEDILQGQTLSKATVEAEPTNPIAAEPVLEAETPEELVTQARNTVATETDAAVEDKPENVDEVHQPGAKSAPEDNRGASFASSPESFHSAEPQSPDSVSTHPTSVGGHDLSEPADMFDLSGTKEIKSGFESMPVDFCSTLQHPKLGLSQCDNGSITQSVGETPSTQLCNQGNLSRRLPDAFSDTSPSMIRTSRMNPASHSQDASPDASTRSQPPSKSTALNTDFDHMSAEFRRRAKATRERDVSPMPHSSAVYLPSGDDTSFISKAITLVLIPPAYLFIILLHIAARIVVHPTPNPTPTITSAPSKPKSRSQHMKKPSAAVDDFSFPLEPQAFSEYEDSPTTKTLDPWDLD
ncbi:hypothetical protein N7475_010403 [Penicillium sp. IBT 31633x]|nr:hypothetical protein N7475_010403 [Penicillium sp. IBT 31633x]